MVTEAAVLGGVLEAYRICLRRNGVEGITGAGVSFP